MRSLPHSRRCNHYHFPVYVPLLNLRQFLQDNHQHSLVDNLRDNQFLVPRLNLHASRPDNLAYFLLANPPDNLLSNRVEDRQCSPHTSLVHILLHNHREYQPRSRLDSLLDSQVLNRLELRPCSQVVYLQGNHRDNLPSGLLNAQACNLLHSLQGVQLPNHRDSRLCSHHGSLPCNHPGSLQPNHRCNPVDSRVANPRYSR